MSLLSFGSSVLLALAGFFGAYVLASVHMPSPPRFGRRGEARRRALEQNGVFATTEPLIRWLSALVGCAPLGTLRARQEEELRRADHFLGLTPDEYSAVAFLSA